MQIKKEKHVVLTLPLCFGKMACLSFSVINFLRVRGSGGFIMNRTWVQQKDGNPPWREIRLFAFLYFGYFFRISRLLVLLPFSR